MNTHQNTNSPKEHKDTAEQKKSSRAYTIGSDDDEDEDDEEDEDEEEEEEAEEAEDDFVSVTVAVDAVLLSVVLVFTSADLAVIIDWDCCLGGVKNVLD